MNLNRKSNKTHFSKSGMKLGSQVLAFRVLDSSTDFLFVLLVSQQQDRTEGDGSNKTDEMHQLEHRVEGVSVRDVIHEDDSMTPGNQVVQVGVSLTRTQERWWEKFQREDYVIKCCFNWTAFSFFTFSIQSPETSSISMTRLSPSLTSTVCWYNWSEHVMIANQDCVGVSRWREGVSRQRSYAKSCHVWRKWTGHQIRKEDSRTRFTCSHLFSQK